MGRPEVNDRLVLCMECGQPQPASTGFAPAQLKKRRPKCRACTGGSGAKMGATATAGHASKLESERALLLRTWERAGAITELRFQVRFELIPAQEGEKALAYVADAVYRDGAGQPVVEDSKGFRTDVYRIKRKLMLWRHGIRILEVEREKRRRQR